MCQKNITSYIIPALPTKTELPPLPQTVLPAINQFVKTLGIPRGVKGFVCTLTYQLQYLHQCRWLRLLVLLLKPQVQPFLSIQITRNH